LRLRGRRLVLALRRRGLAVPVLLHLLVGRRQGADRAPLTREHTSPVLRGRCPRRGRRGKATEPVSIDSNVIPFHGRRCGFPPPTLRATSPVRRGRAVPGST